MSWIESHQSLSRHRKTLRASALLKVDRHKLIGHLHELWWWGLDNADTDGQLNGISDREIAAAAGWPEKGAAVFVGALTTAGFIDADAGGLSLHDWYDYAGKLTEQVELRRQSNRAAQQLRRQRLRADDSHQLSSVTGDDGHDDIDDSQHPTVPNLTQPNPTEGSKDPSKPAARHKPIDEPFLDELQSENPSVNVRQVLAKAENRRTWDGYKDKRRALRDHVGYALEELAKSRTNGTGRGPSLVRDPRAEAIAAGFNVDD